MATSWERETSLNENRSSPVVVGFLHAHLSCLPAGQPHRRAVLQRMWLPARWGGTSSPRGAQGRHGAVRRPRGVHGALRANGSRGRAAVDRRRAIADELIAVAEQIEDI